MPPLPDRGHLLGVGPGEGDDGAEVLGDRQVVGQDAGLPGVHDLRDLVDHGVNVRAREAVGEHDQVSQQVQRRLALGVTAEAQAQDLLTLLLGGQVHEEDGVEPSLAQQLRREGGDVVGRRHEEDLGGGLLHPEQELANEPTGHRVVPRPRGEPLLDLVDPQDAGGGPVRRGQGLAQARLGLPHVHAHDRGHVQTVERQLPLLGDRLGGQRLPAAGDAAEQHALGGTHAPAGQVPGHEALLACQPLLEVLQAADLVVLLKTHPLQTGQGPEDAVLELAQLGQVLVTHLLLGQEGGDDVNGLPLRHPAEDLGGTVDLQVLPLDRDA